MTPRAIEKQRTISTRLNITSHVRIQEILQVTEKTQQPTKIVKINSLHAVSVPPHEVQQNAIERGKRSAHQNHDMES
jgi:hypothetical protein